MYIAAFIKLKLLILKWRLEKKYITIFHFWHFKH